MVSSLKKEFLELLEKDVEFRYAVAGYLGLSEILKRLDKLEENQEKLLENQNKLWENQNKLWENQNKLWEEIKALRESQNKLWENQNKLWEEVRSLREGQNKLWESQNKLWEEVRSLRENQEKLWEEVRSLREDVNDLKRDVNDLKRSFKSFYEDFRELGRAVGMTLENYTASFLRMHLREKGYSEEKINITTHNKFRINGKEIEVNIFNEDPLIVGEVTTYIRDEQEAKNEVEKLLKKKEAIETIYKRKVEMLILAVANIEPHALKLLKEITKKENITLLTGREIHSNT